MDTRYKHILPADIYVSLMPKQAAEDSQPEIMPNEWGNLPADNNFIDLFAGLVRKHGYYSVQFYAKKMGVEYRLMSPTILALTGISPRQWIHEYLILEVCELLENTDLTFTEIGKRFNMSTVSFSRFFKLMRKCQPYEWRTEHKYGKRYKHHFC